VGLKVVDCSLILLVILNFESSILIGRRICLFSILVLSGMDVDFSCAAGYMVTVYFFYGDLLAAECVGVGGVWLVFHDNLSINVSKANFAVHGSTPFPSARKKSVL
jgi:hypothetical protein